MSHPFDSTSSSPDAQHTAYFAYSGEVRFGPLYFSLAVDDYSFGQRMFSDTHLWSPASEFLAVQEWLTLDYSEGPITALVLIDVRLRREATLARVTKGFVVPTAFAGSISVYRKDFGGTEGSERFELDITKITEWNAL